MNKSGYLTKKSVTLSDDDLTLINAFSRKKLKKDEVYVFKMVLCDTEIDRDFECFSIEALTKLAKLFIGKSGVFDHDWSSQNQHGRIFKTEVLNNKLLAYAYLPIIDFTKDLINQIDTGIKKEVSIGCAVSQTICSICGADVHKNLCSHIKGKEYNGEICAHILNDISDAYEWSFVAVPAQRGAGVIKTFEKGEKVMKISDITNAKDKVVIEKEALSSLQEEIKNLIKLSEIGSDYLKSLKDDARKLKSAVLPLIDDKTFDIVLSKLTYDDLVNIKKSTSESKTLKAVSQVEYDSNLTGEKNNDFII